MSLLNLCISFDEDRMIHSRLELQIGLILLGGLLTCMAMAF